MQSHCFKKHLVWYEFSFKKLPRAAWAVMDEPEQSASERSRENAYYERYFSIQITCNMNAKGQTWNENIWTVAGHNEKNPS